MFKRKKTISAVAAIMQIAGGLLLFSALASACGGVEEDDGIGEFIEEGYEDDNGSFTHISDENSGKYSGTRTSEKVLFETVEQALNWASNGRIVEAGRMFALRMGLAVGGVYTVQASANWGAAEVEVYYWPHDGQNPLGNRFARGWTDAEDGNGTAKLRIVPAQRFVIVRITGRPRASVDVRISSEVWDMVGQMVGPVEVRDYRGVAEAPFSTLYRDNQRGGNGFEGAGSHPGVDIAVPSGTLVRAVAAGEVVKSEDSPSWGGLVVVKHVGISGAPLGEPVYSAYAHLRRRDVNVGQWAAKSQTIGLSGGGRDDPNAGRSFAAHLHFQIDSHRNERGQWMAHPYWHNVPNLSPSDEVNMPDDNVVLNHTLNPLVFVQTRD